MRPTRRRRRPHRHRPRRGTQGDSLTIKAIDPSKFERGSSVGSGHGTCAEVQRTRAACGKARGLPAAGRHQRGSQSTSRAPTTASCPGRRRTGRTGRSGRTGASIRAPFPIRTRCTTSSTAPSSCTSGCGSAARPGRRSCACGRTRRRTCWSCPGLPSDVPQRGVTLTSWQRAMICKNLNARVLTAIRTYRDAYRGTGPEQIPSLNSGASAPDLPTPALPDPSAS